MEMKNLVVNGVNRQVLVNDDDMLANVLREQLKLTSVKIGCEKGHCGACSIILDGKLTRTCITKMKRVADGAAITTLEGIGTPGHLHPLQEAWIFHGAAQCGFCTPGFIVAAYALLQENKNPTRQEVRDWFQKNRNVCRCTGYNAIVRAILQAAEEGDGLW